MNTELKNAVLATDLKAQYDACAKKLLGYKDILARILIEAVEEFIFYVSLKAWRSKIIINVEAQRKEPAEYDILNRAVFYASREISSQKNREFVNSNYNDIKKVYSIWICMNMSENSMNHIHLTNDTIIGNQVWKGNEDLVNIVMIGLAKEISPKEEKHELHRLLGALLSETLNEEEKLDILKNEYHIPMKKSIKEDVKIMCNLSEGIEERGIIKGKAELLKQQVQKKLVKGKGVEGIANQLEESVSAIENVLEELRKNA